MSTQHDQYVLSVVGNRNLQKHHKFPPLLQENETITFDLHSQRTASYINSATTGGKYTVVETSTKTKASKRAIRLTDFLIAVLKGHKKKQNEIRLQAGQEWAGKDLVFCGNQGKHFLAASTHFY